MKYFASFLLIISFAAIGMFGFSFMDHSMMQHDGCLTSVFTGAPCPTNQTIFAMHHIAAFQAFLSAVVPPVLAGFFLAFLLLCLALYFFTRLPVLVPAWQIMPRTRDGDEQCLPDYGLRRTLALFELSPSFS